MKKVYISIFILVIVIISCRNITKPKSIDIFFKPLENSIERDKLMAFKNAPKDSAVFYFKRFEDDFLKIYHDSTQISILDNFFNSYHILKQSDNRVYSLCFAFHSKLNHKSFNEDILKQDIYKELLKINEEWEKKEKLLDLEKFKIMQTNGQKWHVGDIINVNLPVSFKDGNKSTLYCNNYPASLDYSSFDDSLQINGKLLRKEYYAHTYPDSSKIDTTEIIFKIDILKVSNNKYKIFDNKCKVGDSFNLYLSAYGRLIL